jgi:hypothetical protein
LRNLVAVALANVEGMVDGIVPPTPARLENVAERISRNGYGFAVERPDL